MPDAFPRMHDLCEYAEHASHQESATEEIRQTLWNEELSATLVASPQTDTTSIYVNPAGIFIVRDHRDHSTSPSLLRGFRDHYSFCLCSACQHCVLLGLCAWYVDRVLPQENGSELNKSKRELDITARVTQTYPVR